MLTALLDWWSGIWALLERSLRIDARQLSQHLFRLGTVVAVYGAIVFSEWSGLTFGAPGLRYFRQLAYLNIAFITLAGVSYFSSAISEEKEEDTLGLMLMAGISPLGILLGKSAGRLIQAAILLTVQFPFTWLAITLGGVTRGQIVQTYVALVAFLVLQANAALVASVVCRRSRDAAALTFFGQAMYFLLPLLAQAQYADLQSKGWRFGMGGLKELWLRFLGGLGECSVVFQLQEILTTAGTASLFNVQTASNFAGGLALFLLARLLFGWGTRDLATDAAPRGLLTLRSSRGRWPGSGRVRGNALAWKDFHFTCGGWPIVFVKIVGHAALFGFIVSQFYDDGRTTLNWRDPIVIYFGIGLFLTFLDAAWSFGRIYHEELKLQTWPTLFMMPRSLANLAYSKGLGVLLGLLPSAACLSLPFLTGYMTWDDIAFSLEHPDTWVIYATGLALIHLTTLYSVLLKWGALPLAFATIIAMTFVWEMTTMTVIRSGLWDYRDEINVIATALLLIGCGVCHLLVGMRLRSLATH